MFASQRPASLTQRLAASRWQLFAATLCVLALFLLVPSGPGRLAAGRLRKQSAQSDGASKPARNVLVELFVMSLCPDARFCVSEWSVIQSKLPGVMTLRAETIAKESGSSLVCMHGSSECHGNKALLCLQAQLSATDPRLADGLHCLIAGSPHDPAHLRACMTSMGLEEEVQGRVTACVTGPEGDSLALASARVVKSRNVTKSCTVFIDGVKRCIRVRPLQRQALSGLLLPGVAAAVAGGIAAAAAGAAAVHTWLLHTQFSHASLYT